MTIVGELILNYIMLDHNSDDSSDNSPGNNISLNDYSNNGPGHKITLDDSTHTDAADDVSSNGTMPRGTAPQNISISEEMKEILVSIQKLSTGSSKDWIDNKLGPPFASNVVEITQNSKAYPHTDENDIVGEVLECVYLFDIVSVKIYFSTPDNSCIAFFVTLMVDTLNFDLVMPEAYSVFVSNKPLGEFTFADIDGEPMAIYGYVSNGVGRVFYGEEYYFMGGGNYQYFYFATLDYGMLDSLSQFDQFLSEIQFDISPNNVNGTNALSSSDLLSQQRSKLYPNTYGISRLNEELTLSLFSSYSAFDSAALRKRS